MFSNGPSLFADAFPAEEAPRRLSHAQPVVSGILSGTLVEADAGWQAVETLLPGQRLHTLDGGLARILSLHRRLLWPECGAALIHVPGGLLDACSDILLLPGQHVLVDTLGCETPRQAPYLMLPAAALSCLASVRAELPDLTVEVITPLFAEEEVIFANSGMMLHCPSLIDGAGRFPENSFFPRLDMDEARDFLAQRAAHRP